MSRLVPWDRHVDPRKRILALDPDGRRIPERVALLGDSVFASDFTHEPEETLWAQLGERLGETVFPGALTGAQPVDLELAASILGRSMKPGSTVLLDFHAGRGMRIGNLPDQNYEQALRATSGVDAPWDGTLPAGLAIAFRKGLLQLELYRRKAALREILDRAAHPATPSRQSPEDDPERILELASRRWQTAWTHTTRADPAELLPWVLRISEELRDRDIRLVVVLTPMNDRFILDLEPEEGASIIRAYEEARAAAVDFLLANGVEVLDATTSVGPGGFADLNHMNARGEAALARFIAEALAHRDRER